MSALIRASPLFVRELKKLIQGDPLLHPCHGGVSHELPNIGAPLKEIARQHPPRLGTVAQTVKVLRQQFDLRLPSSSNGSRPLSKFERGRKRFILFLGYRQKRENVC